MNQQLIVTLCVFTVLFSLLASKAKSMLKTLISTWLQALFVSGLLLESGFEYVAFVLLISATLLVILISVYTGTLAGDLRAKLDEQLKKPTIIFTFVGILVASALAGALYFVGNSDITHIINANKAFNITDIGNALLSKYKIVALSVSLLVLTIITGSSLIIHITDREIK